jgi:AbrB family looped-hinge helix DNA binding protein
MSLVKVRTKAQITLPLKVRQALGIEEGDYLQVRVQGNTIVLVPQTLVTKLPPVSLSKEGEGMLEEALEDVRKGRVEEHDSVDSLIEELHHEAH